MSDTAWINILITYSVISCCALILIGKYCYRMGKRIGAVETKVAPFETLKTFRELNSGNNGQHKKAAS